MRCRAEICAVVLLAIGTQPAFAKTPDPDVRVVVDDASRRACKYLGLVNVRKALGTNKAGGALKKALRAVSDMGGNGLFIISQAQDWATGASISGEALDCPASVIPR